MIHLLNQLWKRFFEGKTSLEEEKKLKINQPELPYFQYLEEEKKRTLDFSFDHLLKESKDKSAAKTIRLSFYRRYENLIKKVSIAAVVLLCLGFYFGYRSHPKPVLIIKNGQSITDETTAVKEMKAAFVFLSEQLAQTQVRLKNIQYKVK